MLKINLLPAYILERQRIRSVVVVVLVVLVLEGAILGLLMMRYKGRLADGNAEFTYWQQRASQVDKIQAATASTQTDAHFYGRWKEWTDKIDAYHAVWGEIYGEIVKWIYAKMQVNSINLTQSAVNISGTTDSLESFRTAYLNILRSPLYSNVSFAISGVRGGWQPPSATRPAQRTTVIAPVTRGSRGREEEDKIALMGQYTSLLGAAGPVPAATGVGAPSRAVRSVAAQPRRLPITVRFSCALRPQYGQRMIAPQPPMAAGGPVARGAGAATGAGALGGAGVAPEQMQQLMERLGRRD